MKRNAVIQFLPPHAIAIRLDAEVLLLFRRGIDEPGLSAQGKKAMRPSLRATVSMLFAKKTLVIWILGKESMIPS